MSFIKYPTAEDIADMKARGFEPQTIREAEERAARRPAMLVLCEQIREAFRGVTLGNGVGLNEAVGLDDYADEAALARYHAEDERDDWTRIPMDRLPDSGLTFTDDEGMRFLLPVYLLAELLGFSPPLFLGLTVVYGGMCGKFGLFTPAQRAAVRAFLIHVADDPDFEWDREEILQVIRGSGYWAEVWDPPGWH